MWHGRKPCTQLRISPAVSPFGSDMDPPNARNDVLLLSSWQADYLSSYEPHGRVKLALTRRQGACLAMLFMGCIAYVAGLLGFDHFPFPRSSPASQSFVSGPQHPPTALPTQRVVRPASSSIAPHRSPLPIRPRHSREAHFDDIILTPREKLIPKDVANSIRDAASQTFTFEYAPPPFPFPPNLERVTNETDLVNPEEAQQQEQALQETMDMLEELKEEMLTAAEETANAAERRLKLQGKFEETLSSAFAQMQRLFEAEPAMQSSVVGVYIQLNDVITNMQKQMRQITTDKKRVSNGLSLDLTHPPIFAQPSPYRRPLSPSLPPSLPPSRLPSLPPSLSLSLYLSLYLSLFLSLFCLSVCRSETSPTYC